MSGIVTGGWGFVWAAYGITFAALVAYGLQLAHKVRRSDEESRDE